TAPSSKSSGFGILLISSTNGAPLFAGANGSSAGTEAAADGVDAAGADTGMEFIGLLDGADTMDAVVDAHLIIFASAVALFACRTSSLLPVNSIRTSSSASCPIEIAIFTAFRNQGIPFNLSRLFL